MVAKSTDLVAREAAEFVTIIRGKHGDDYDKVKSCLLEKHRLLAEASSQQLKTVRTGLRVETKGHERTTRTKLSEEDDDPDRNVHAPSITKTR